MTRFEYDAKVRRVVDGDTYDVDCDLGFSIRHRVRVRLLGVDTHETYGVPKDSEEYSLGKQEAAFVEEWFETAHLSHEGEFSLIIQTHKDERGKYGRYLATISRKSDDEQLGPALIEEYPEVKA